ncbi:MAG: CCA tRNA nucleotidyltransferase [Candidatus Hecatellales archaeon]|nr:MAG: CCA tRNA nucleotidyltransferase [Candidatus Hecatellales archaeon]
MKDSLDKILEEVRGREVPTSERYGQVLGLAERIRRRVEEEALNRGVFVEASVEGSVAKDTWLGSEVDIDIFMLIPEEVEKEKIFSVYMDVARESVREYGWIERYAEHPYVEAVVDGGIKINIVPCYKVKPPNWKTATDRTPYHTQYIKTHLKEEQKNEVRILKRFMKGIKVYGADIKTGGFSGYLTELLIIRYGNFIETLKSVSKWRIGETIDIENHYGGEIGEIKKLFTEPLILIDPADKNRNVAAAVRLEKLNIFRVASKLFLKKPSLKFFYPPKIKPPNPENMEKLLDERPSNLLFLKLGRVEAVPDVLWGQIYKTSKAIKNLLEKNDFKVLRVSAWSDEKENSVLVFELENLKLENIKKHYGPPVSSSEEENFVGKYLGSQRTVSGPYVEDGRWVVLIKRKYLDAKRLLEEKLGRGKFGRDFGVAGRVSEALRRGFNIFVDGEIIPFYRENVSFASFLAEFLRGKPSWLE